MSAFKEARDFYRQKKKEEKLKKKLLGKKSDDLFQLIFFTKKISYGAHSVIVFIHAVQLV